MRYAKYVMAIVAVLCFASLGALNFYLHVDHVYTSSLTGTLMIRNTDDQMEVLIFPSRGTFDLMVDGNISNVDYADSLTFLEIPANSNISLNVSYIGTTPFSQGSHHVRARYVLPGNPPAGGSSVIYYGTPVTGLDDVQYRFSITSVGAQSVVGNLRIFNPNTQYWKRSFPYGFAGRIFVDGVQPSGVLYLPFDIPIYIDPGEEYVEEIYHQTSTPYSVGTHVADARLFLSDDIPVSIPVNFVISPVANDDQSIPSVQETMVRFSPNPVKQHEPLHITFSGDGVRNSDQIEIRIYNLKGQRVAQTSLNGNGTNELSTVLNLHDAPAGTYIYQAQVGKEQIKGKFTVLAF